jgi:hypothetical protein
VVLLAQLVVYLLAIAGVVSGALGMILFAGGAMNRARPVEVRRQRWLFATLCLCGIVASAVGGFVGIGAIMYLAQQ